LRDLQAWWESRFFDFSTMRLFHGLDLLFGERRQELSLRAVLSDTVSSDGEGKQEYGAASVPRADNGPRGSSLCLLGY
jgi:hypothetical protein